MGRFTSPDPKMFTARHLLYPQKWNKYAYVQNNPLANIDPDGLDDYKVFIVGASGGNWAKAKAAAEANGHTFTIYRGKDATVQRYNQALGDPNARVVFVGHTSHGANSSTANAVVLGNGRSAGANSVQQVVTPTSTPGTVNATEQPLPTTTIKADSVTAIGCNSADLSSQYSSTNFVGLASGTNNGTTLPAEGSTAAAWVAADAAARPENGNPAPNAVNPVDAADSALKQSPDPQDHDGDKVIERKRPE